MLKAINDILEQVQKKRGSYFFCLPPFLFKIMFIMYNENIKISEIPDLSRVLRLLVLINFVCIITYSAIQTSIFFIKFTRAFKLVLNSSFFGSDILSGSPEHLSPQRVGGFVLKQFSKLY